MARVDVGALARGVERTVPFDASLGLTLSFAGAGKEAGARYQKARPSAGPKQSTMTVPEYVLAILRLVGWAAYVAGVFWLVRMAAKGASLTAGGRRLALCAISVVGGILNLIVFRTAATLLAEPLDLVLIAAVGFGAIAVFFAVLTAE
jgi:hypothetical protein